MNATQDPAKIICRNIWKVYGPNPARFLEQHGFSPSPEVLMSNGYIGAVRDVSFDITAGEILVIMGLSGSGKSTLVRCLSVLTPPTAGEIEFDGRDLLRVSERELIELRRHKMGMVFQHFGLIPHRTVLGNVAFPLEVRGMKRDERESKALEQIALVGLEGRESYYPRELSGGQQQRVGIARSLITEPEIWFLDEPFSALDPLIRHDMQDELLRLQSSLKKTVVFVTHDFDEAIKIADRIAIMKDGALVQLGRPEELVMAPANDYVARFTRDVPRAKVLTARAIMVPCKESGSLANGVPASATLEQIAPHVMHDDRPVPVVDDDGTPIGMLTRDLLLDVFFRMTKHPGA